MFGASPKAPKAWGGGVACSLSVVRFWWLRHRRGQGYPLKISSLFLGLPELKNNVCGMTAKVKGGLGSVNETPKFSWRVEGTRTTLWACALRVRRLECKRLRLRSFGCHKAVDRRLSGTLNLKPQMAVLLKAGSQTMKDVGANLLGFGLLVRPVILALG